MAVSTECVLKRNKTTDQASSPSPDAPPVQCVTHTSAHGATTYSSSPTEKCSKLRNTTTACSSLATAAKPDHRASPSLRPKLPTWVCNRAENDLNRSQEVEPSTEVARTYRLVTATYQNNRASLVRPLTVQPKLLSHHTHHDHELHLCNASHTHTYTQDPTERDNLQFLHHDERMSHARQRNNTPTREQASYFRYRAPKFRIPLQPYTGND